MRFLAPLLVSSLFTASSFAGNFFGAGPWANGWYYAGQMDGKYQASITGVNIAGALGFAFQDGSPSTAAGANTQAAVSAGITADPALNYFVVFVQGVTYSGTTTATMNVEQGTVTGALYSEQNAFTTIDTSTTIFITNGTTITTEVITVPTLDNLAMLNRGVNGGFTANIDSKKATFTFSGAGELSSPAFPQSVLGFDTNGNVVPPSQFISNAVTAVVETATVPFDIQGIKTSFSGSSPTTGSTPGSN